MTSTRKFLEWSLLGMLASSYLAVVSGGSLDLPSLVLAGSAILLRGLIVSGVLRLRIPDAAVNAAAIAYIGFYPLDYYYFSREFLPATVHLVFFLASVLVLRARTRRDFFFVKLSSFLQIIAASLLSNGLIFLVFLSFFAVFAIGAQVSGEIETSLELNASVAAGGTRGASRRLAVLAVSVFAGVLLLAGGFFVILPRTARAAFQHVVSSRFHLPGFSNEVRLGQIGEIRQTTTPVMHVRVQNADRLLQLKWRGSALAQFDGKRWYNEPAPSERLLVEHGQVLLARTRQWRLGAPISYEVQLKDVTSDVLFFAGVPEILNIDAPHVIRTSVDGYRAGIIGGGTRYQVFSFLEIPDPTPNPLLTPLAENLREYYTRTPNLDRRIGQLAESLAAPEPTQLRKSRAIEKHLRTSYGYTMQLLDTPVDDPLAHFLFVRKQGHCEYFASSMAVMLRSLGIPARVATGFQSGVFNPLTGWYVIRASDAHSWVEAWLDNYGWVTFDPTPPDPNPPQLGVFHRWTMYMDALEVFWQEWVMSYDLQRQVLIADRMGRRSRNFSTDWMDNWSEWKLWWSQTGKGEAPRVLAAGVIALVSVVLLYLFGPKLWAWARTRARVRKLRHGKASPSDATLLYDRMLALLQRRGIAKPPWVTPLEFAGMIPQPEPAAIVAQLTHSYNTLRFSPKQDEQRGESARKMVALLDRLEESLR